MGGGGAEFKSLSFRLSGHKNVHVVHTPGLAHREQTQGKYITSEVLINALFKMCYLFVKNSS